MQQVSKKGWRTSKREPGDELISQERPQLVIKMIEATYGSPPDVAQMRRDFGIPMSLLRSLLQSYGAGGPAPMSSVLTMVSR